MESKNEEALNIIVEGLLYRDKEVVFVFGAGASMDSGLPSGNKLQKELAEFLTPLANTWKVRSIIKKIPKEFISLSDAPLECNITILAEAYGEDRALEWLITHIPKDLKNPVRYFPSIAYEFISHLMGSGLIRYVINLNYDELLEMALDEELGDKPYKKVSTEEEFHQLARELERISRDNYFIIKPHGTISSPMSLVHRYEKALEFGKDKTHVLERVFENSIVVLIGYEANDEDFMIFFTEQLLFKKISKAIIVKGRPDRVIDKFPETARGSILPYYGQSFKFFNDLAGKLSNISKYYNYYTKATRHFIRASLYKKFAPDSEQPAIMVKKLKDINIKDPLFFSRFNLLIEILIFCFKVRGLFADTALMSCNRIVYAIKEYINICKKSKLQQEELEPHIREILDSLVRRNYLKMSADKIPRTIGSYWYYLPVKKDGNLPPEYFYIEAAKEILEMLNECYFKKVDYPLNEDEIQKLAKCFYEVQNDFDYDLGRDYTSHFIFKNPKVFENRKDFREASERILKDIDRNSHLYITSAQAEWLFNRWEEIPKKPCNIKIIINKDLLITDSIHYRNSLEILRKKLSQLPNDWTGAYYSSPIDSCNVEIKGKSNLKHHITLLCKETDGSPLIGKAIYFEREGKASSFTPFLLENTEDIQSLKKFFDDLWDVNKP